MIRRRVETDGLAQSVLEAGEGPLVLLSHGFPELGYSWRAQIPALAAAGYWAVAPDMRGYGQAECPEDVDAYGVLEIVGDMVDLVRALGRETATIVGHDWGAHIAWQAALLRPDVFTAVAALSVPFRPRSPAGPPTSFWRLMSARHGKGDFYIVRLQEPGIEAEFDADPDGALLRLFRAYDGATPDAERSDGSIPQGRPFFATMPRPSGPPPWMSAEDFAAYAEAYRRSGFAGPINWYRNVDRNWALSAFAQGLKVRQPALFLTGDLDPVRGYSAVAEAELSRWATDLRELVVIEGGGHWIQQERPDEVNAALIRFLQAVA